MPVLPPDLSNNLRPDAIKSILNSIRRGMTPADWLGFLCQEDFQEAAMARELIVLLNDCCGLESYVAAEFTKEGGA